MSYDDQREKEESDKKCGASPNISQHSSPDTERFDFEFFKLTFTLKAFILGRPVFFEFSLTYSSGIYRNIHREFPCPQMSVEKMYQLAKEDIFLLIKGVTQIMCLAIPSKIVEIENDLGIIDVDGVQRQVSLFLIENPPQAHGSTS